MGVPAYSLICLTYYPNRNRIFCLYKGMGQLQLKVIDSITITMKMSLFTLQIQL